LVEEDNDSQDLSDIPKLVDAKLDGTDEWKKCTLILTEGDSGKAMAVFLLLYAIFVNLM
jgi:hypothetical protein